MGSVTDLALLLLLVLLRVLLQRHRRLNDNGHRGPQRRLRLRLPTE